MKTKWSSKIPSESGWYWVKYRGKNRLVICPASVYIDKDFQYPIISSAHNDTFYDPKHFKSLKFGPEIPFPN